MPFFQKGSGKITNTDTDRIMPLNWGKEDGITSIRVPVGLKANIDKFLNQVELETGVKFKRNTFILNSIRFYLRYLSQARNTPDLVERLKEEFKTIEVDNGTIEGNVEE